MRVILVAVVLVISSTVARAQTVEAALNIAALGWGDLRTPESIEIDGDFATREWLIRRDNEMRVVAERTDGRAPCAGAWFIPALGWLDKVSVQRVGVTHRLVVQAYPYDEVVIVRLDMPVCEG